MFEVTRTKFFRGAFAMQKKKKKISSTKETPQKNLASTPVKDTTHKLHIHHLMSVSQRDAMRDAFGGLGV